MFLFNNYSPDLEPIDFTTEMTFQANEAFVAWLCKVFASGPIEDATSASGPIEDPVL